MCHHFDIFLAGNNDKALWMAQYAEGQSHRSLVLHEPYRVQKGKTDPLCSVLVRRTCKAASLKINLKVQGLPSRYGNECRNSPVGALYLVRQRFCLSILADYDLANN
jgi:hypothetical protein